MHLLYQFLLKFSRFYCIINFSEVGENALFFNPHPSTHSPKFRCSPFLGKRFVKKILDTGKLMLYNPDTGGKVQNQLGAFSIKN